MLIIIYVVYITYTYLYIYIHISYIHTYCAQNSQKQDERNTYVIMKTMGHPTMAFWQLTHLHIYILYLTYTDICYVNIYIYTHISINIYTYIVVLVVYITYIAAMSILEFTSRLVVY